jgi:hypothetical protein
VLARDDDARLLFLSSKGADITSAPVASVHIPPFYVVQAGLGSPAQLIQLALNTSADDTWAYCSPCSSCLMSTNSQLFAPANSTSYFSLPCFSTLCSIVQGQPCPSMQDPSDQLLACAFSKPFADASFHALLASDTLHLGKDAIPNYVFGCVDSVSGSMSNLPRQGLLGLGRGPMALLSQVGKLLLSPHFGQMRRWAVTKMGLEDMRATYCWIGLARGFGLNCPCICILC